MKLGISNIAWDPADLLPALDLLQSYGAAGLEIAPGLAFPGEEDPFQPADRSIESFKSLLRDRAIDLVSMQSLLFGVSGAKLFGTDEELDRFKVGIRRAVKLAGELEIPNLVMGSPKNRAYPDTFVKADAESRARDIFRELGEYADEVGTQIAIEPNPAAYGTNFLNTVEEAANFVAAVDHCGISLNFDIGAYQTNNEASDPATLLTQSGGRVSHVHISEFELVEAPADAGEFRRIAKSLLQAGYDRWFSIEMRRADSNALDRVERSLRICSDILQELDFDRA